MACGGYLRGACAKFVEALGLNAPWVDQRDAVLFDTAEEADKGRDELMKDSHLREPVLSDDGKTVSISVDFPARLKTIWSWDRSKLCVISGGVVEVAFAIDAAGISKKAISITTVCGSISSNRLLRSHLTNAEMHTLGKFKDSDYEQCKLHLGHLVADCKVRAPAASHPPSRHLPCVRFSAPFELPQAPYPLTSPGAHLSGVQAGSLVGAGLRDQPRLLQRARQLQRRRRRLVHARR